MGGFCHEYSLNQKDNKNGVPGVLYGRYRGDHYAGGNPWQLLTAVLAETFYKYAGYVESRIEENLGQDFMLEDEEFKSWKTLLKLDDEATALDTVKASASAGDAVMYRMFQHVKADNGEIDEQMDRSNGQQKSAKNLTWSYANV